MEICIVLVNYNGLPDTLRCLCSLEAAGRPDPRKNCVYCVLEDAPPVRACGTEGNVRLRALLPGRCVSRPACDVVRRHYGWKQTLSWYVMSPISRSRL
jgi:hypothetical protein